MWLIFDFKLQRSRAPGAGIDVQLVDTFIEERAAAILWNPLVSKESREVVNPTEILEPLCA